MATVTRVAVLFVLFQTAAYAQVEVRGTVGLAAFPDDSWDQHVLAGGAVLAKVRSGLRIGAEALVLSGMGEDRDISLMPVLSYEFGTRRVQPYVIGGVGLLRHREMTGTGLYWSNGATFGAGGGVKFNFSDRWFVAPEVRAGWEPFFRASFNIGYRF